MFYKYFMQLTFRSIIIDVFISHIYFRNAFKGIQSSFHLFLQNVV